MDATISFVTVCSMRNQMRFQMNRLRKIKNVHPAKALQLEMDLTSRLITNASCGFTFILFPYVKQAIHMHDQIKWPCGKCIAVCVNSFFLLRSNFFSRWKATEFNPKFFSKKIRQNARPKFKYWPNFNEKTRRMALEEAILASSVTETNSYSNEFK